MTVDTQGPESGLDEAKVQAWLRGNPDFLKANAELLREVDPPERWSGDGVVDMQRWMVERQRAELGDLKDQTREMILASRENMDVLQRTHAAALALLAADGLDGFARVVVQELPVLLDVDMVTMVFEHEDAALGSGGAPFGFLPVGAVDHLLQATGGEARLFSQIADDGSLFGPAAEAVQSAALARLRPGHGVPTGLMILGSTSDTFHEDQATDLLRFLARVLEACAHRWLGNTLS